MKTQSCGILKKISLNSVVTCLVPVAGSHPDYFANFSVWGKKKSDLYLLTFPWPHGCFKMQAEIQIHSNSLDHIPSSFTPGETDWSLFHFQNICSGLINICWDLPQDRLSSFHRHLFGFYSWPLSALLYPLSVLRLWCNVNNMQKTVWSIPINAVTRLLWVFCCVVTCIVLSILSW